MQAALFTVLAVALGAPNAPAANDAAVDAATVAAARSYRIEAYNQHLHDAPRYRELREIDADVRGALKVSGDATLPQRRDEAIAWYREATDAIHSGGEIPNRPVWVAEALAQAKLENETLASEAASPAEPSTPAFVWNAPNAAEADAANEPSISVPPTLTPAASNSAATIEDNPTPFSVVNAMLRAVASPSAESVAGDADADDENAADAEPVDPIIEPAGPVDEFPEPAAPGDEISADDLMPTIEFPSLDPAMDATFEETFGEAPSID